MQALWCSLKACLRLNHYNPKHPLLLPQDQSNGEIQSMLHSIKTDLLLHQSLSGVLHDSKHKGYWWMRWSFPNRPVSHCHVHVYLCIWGKGGGKRKEGGEKAESAFCIRYWFLISGLRYKHLSMLYIVPAQLRILSPAPSALWKWIMCRWESRLKCGQQRTFSKCLCYLKAVPERGEISRRREFERERGRKKRRTAPFPACIAY